MDRPHFIIIGAMKSATSTLHAQLARQPGIFMTKPKEPCFFSDDAIFARGAEWYETLFEKAGESDLCGESSTHYTKLPDYPATVLRIQQYCPSARFIYVMRHPIARLKSHFVHEWSEGRISCSINTASERFPSLVQYGRYAYQLLPYLQTFGASRILPVFYARLIARPQEELERVCRFIGLQEQPHWSPLDERHNASAERMRKSAWRDAVVYAPGISWVRRKLVPKWIRNSVKRAWQYRSSPKLSIGHERTLVEVFNEDLKQLGDWLGVDLTCDSFDAATRDQPHNWTRSAIHSFPASSTGSVAKPIA